MEFGEIITTVIAALSGGGLGSIIGWRAKKRQEQADAAKTETEVKAGEIDNIQAIVEKVYQPTIDALSKQVAELRAEVKQVRKENEQLKDENAELRDVIREIRPDLVPNKRSEQAKEQARSSNGRFVKKEGRSDEN